MAQAYVNAYRVRDAATICLVLLPEQRATYARNGGGRCERFIEKTFMHQEPSITMGAVHEYGGQTPVEATVFVQGDPKHFIKLLKFGSVWRVVESWGLT